MSKSGPSWQDASRPKTYSSLPGDISIEVLVIGGGMAGIMTAHQLSRAGVKVAVVEKDRIGKGATEYTTAFLTRVIDTGLSELVRMFGARSARLIWESHQAAIEEIEKTVRAENIFCGLVRCPALVYAQTEKAAKELEGEYQAAQKLGFNTHLHPPANLPFRNFGSWAVLDQGKFHPLRYLHALAEAAAAAGALIFEKTEALTISGRKHLKIHTNRGSISCERVILATYYPLENPVQTLFKKGMYRSYVLEAKLPTGLIPEGIYWDLANPYNYFRIDPQAGFDRMILGGQDHREEIKMNPRKNFEALEDYLGGLLMGTRFQISGKWTGPILEPSDGLALIGEFKPNRYVATAFSGNGMTYSMISALLLRDRILGKKNPWEKIYDPARIPTPRQLWLKGRDYLGEFLGGAVKNTLKYRRS